MALFSPYWLVLVGVVLLLLAGVVVAFTLAARRARSAGDPSPIVSVTLSLAALFAAFSLLGGIINILVTLLQQQVVVTVPVREFWPELPAGTIVDGTTAERVGGGFTSAELLVDGLSTGARVTRAIAIGFAWLVPGAIAGFIAVACFQLLRGRPFGPALARLTTITAVVVTVGGIAGEVLGDVAGNLAAAEVLGFTGGGYNEVAGIEDVFAAWLPQPGFGIDFPFWPLGAGLALAALAAIFRYGSRLQRDTDGLV